MLVRLALEDDVDEVVAMARANIESTCPHMVFDESKCRETFDDYLATASPTIFVAESKGRVVGFLLSDIHDYRAASGFFTTQEVLFVKPDHRGTRAAAALMKHLVAWSERLGAKEIVGGNDNGFHSDRTAKFLEHFGFMRVGTAMRRVCHGRPQERR